MYSKFLIFISLLALSACAAIFPDRTAPKSAAYHVDAPKGDWVSVPVSENADATDSLKADIAYEHKTSGAIISLNSVCRKYLHTSLNDLTNNLVRGIGERKVIAESKRDLAGAEAKDTTFEGVVDGVKINIRTVVMMKDSCTYDFIHVVVPSKDKTSKKDFEEFLKSFRIDA